MLKFVIEKGKSVKHAAFIIFNLRRCFSSGQALNFVIFSLCGFYLIPNRVFIRLVFYDDTCFLDTDQKIFLGLCQSRLSIA